MNDIPDELRLFRSQLLDAIDRDLQRRSPRSRVTQRRSFRLGVPALAIVAVAAAAVVIGLTLTAASAPSAYAAARKALAATEAAPSGTMTLTDGRTAVTTEWNDGNIAMTGGKVLGPLQQFLIVGGGVYVQQFDGSWLHYADASNVPAVLAHRVQLARNNVAGNTADQILALTTGIQQTAQPDGTTVYTGTVPNSTVNPDSTLTSSDDVLMRMIAGLRVDDDPGGMQLRMTAGSDGAVQEVDLTRGDTLRFTYSRLGSTPPIAAPANATEMAPGAVPPAFTNAGEVFAAK